MFPVTRSLVEHDYERASETRWYVCCVIRYLAVGVSTVAEAKIKKSIYFHSCLPQCSSRSVVLPLPGRLMPATEERAASISSKTVALPGRLIARQDLESSSTLGHSKLHP